MSSMKQIQALVIQLTELTMLKLAHFLNQHEKQSKLLLATATAVSVSTETGYRGTDMSHVTTG